MDWTHWSWDDKRELLVPGKIVCFLWLSQSHPRCLTIKQVLKLQPSPSPILESELRA
jgi:hypothetical protein